MSSSLGSQPPAEAGSPGFSLRTLPKPVLFGLLGAVGGLLGAVLLGQLLWWLLLPPPRVRLTAPVKVAAYPGSKEVLVPVRVERRQFDGPIELEAVSPPTGITVTPATIAAEAKDGKVQLSVGTLQPGNYPVKLRARRTDSDVQAESEFVLEVLKVPATLAVSAPGSVEVFQKGKGQFIVKIARLEFAGPVKVEFPDLPAGLTVPGGQIAANQTEGQFELSASDLAAAATHGITVRVTGPDGAPKASAAFEVAVKKPPAPKVDVVFVIDVSASMDWAIKGVRDGVGTFAEQLKAKGLDFRVGVVLFNNHEDRKAFGGKWAWALEFAKEKFTTDPNKVKAEMANWKADGGGDNESSYDGLNEACQMDFRKDASKVLLLVSDEPPLDPKIFPFKPDFNIKSREQMIDVLKDKRIDQLHLVVRPQHHQDFRQLQAGVRTNHDDKFFDLTKVAQDPSSGEGFAKLLPELSKEIARVTVAGGAALPVAQAPPAPDAQSAPPAPEQPRVSTPIAEGNFTSEDTPRLLLGTAIWSAVVAAGIGLLLAAGQNLYSRRTWFVPLDLLKGAGGGALAGLIGGAAGILLSQFMPAEPRAVGEVVRLLGWTALGALSGLGLSFFVPNLRAWKGLAGGAAGGLAGGLGFVVVVLLLGSDSSVGRWLGAALLGLAIGLMIAFAEQLFRQVWLEVRYDMRETITVNLGPEPVKVGSDAMACAVFARGAAPVALRFWLLEGKVFYEDVPNRRQEEAPIDRPMKAGAISVVVRSASVPGAASGPAPPEPPRPPAPAPAVAITPQPPRLSPAVQARPAPAPAKKGENCPRCGAFVPFKPGFRECTACGHEF